MTIKKLECDVDYTDDVFAAINELSSKTVAAAKGATVCLFGSSSSFYQKDTTRNDSTLAASVWAYALAELGDAVDVTVYAGVGGNNTQEMLDRIDADVLAHDTDWVFMNAGVNDFYGYDFSAQTVFDNVVNIVTQITNNGSKVLLLSCPPQLSSRTLFTPAKSKANADYNRMIAEWTRDIEGVVLVDAYSDAVDHNDAVNGEAILGYIGTDGIHAGLYGSWATGNRVKEALKPFIKQESNTAALSPLTSGDYSLSLNQVNFNGTGGLSQTDALGIVPDNWRLTRTSGEGTVTGANVGGYYQMQINKLVDSSSNFRVETDNMSGLLSGGENLSIEVVLGFDSKDLLLEELRVYSYYVYDGGFHTVDWGRSYNGFTPLPNMKSDNLLITINDTVVPALTSNFRVYVAATFSGIGDATVTLKGLRINNA